MLDLCLINPPHPFLSTPDAQAPIGLLYVAGAAQAAGLSVAICDLAAARLRPLPELPEARCYGITGTFLDGAAINVVATEAKIRSGGRARVIVGGPVSLTPERLDASVVDTVVFGEAEADISRLATEDVGPRFRCAKADVKAVPWPARRLWPGKLGGTIFWKGDYFDGGSTTILSSRGCPWNCAFCAGPRLNGGKVRWREPEDVVAEMENCVRDFGIRQFRFSDENLTCRREHIEGLCEAIGRSDILGRGEGIAWRASLTVRPNDPGLWRMMRAAGCREVSFGVESADPAVLERLNCKKGTVEDSMTALRNARAAGLVARALMMIGTPGERRETAVLNLEFLTRGEYDVAAVAVFHPLPGCAVAEAPERFGCRLRWTPSDTSVCLYGPNGRNRIEPTIEVEGLTVEELRHQMRLVVDMAERLGTVGKG